jgi:glycerol-3-phosphate dehydrogenase
MPRLTRRVSGSTFDLVVVGGGIHGLFAALEAALQGWSVALFERDDYGSGLSSNHQRTVHGGLRALQSGRFHKTRAQIAERRAWAIMAPHLLRPLPFLFPTHRDLMRSRLAIGSALRVYDWLGRHRNVGLPEPLHLPPSRIETLDETKQRFPGLELDGVTGGAVWHDYQLRHPDRLNWLVALAAQRAGALVFNHAEVDDLLRENGRLAGVRVTDRLSDRRVDVSARRVLICAGGGTPVLHARLGLASSPLLVRASGLLVSRPALDLALAVRGRSGRVLTATPWSGCWLIGTFQDDRPAVAGTTPRPSQAEVDAMIDDANGAFPTLQLRRRDVRLVHSGLTPAVVRRGRAELMPESTVVAHAATGHPDVYSIVGVKFTTARATAIDALRRMRLADGPPSPVPRPAAPDPMLLPHGSAEGAVDAVRAACLAAGVELDDDVSRHLVEWYGTEAAEVMAVSAAASRVQRLAPGSPIIEGELLYAVERSQAARLADVVLRRTRLGTAGHPGRAALDRAADVLTNHFGWSVEERAAQIAEVEARYTTSGTTGTTGTTGDRNMDPGHHLH